MQDSYYIICYSMGNKYPSVMNVNIFQKEKKKKKKGEKKARFFMFYKFILGAWKMESMRGPIHCLIIKNVGAMG